MAGPKLSPRPWALTFYRQASVTVRTNRLGSDCCFMQMMFFSICVSLVDINLRLQFYNKTNFSGINVDKIIGNFLLILASYQGNFYRTNLVLWILNFAIGFCATAHIIVAYWLYILGSYFFIMLIIQLK